jgi:hypothetical protein
MRVNNGVWLLGTALAAVTTVSLLPQEARAQNFRRIEPVPTRLEAAGDAQGDLDLRAVRGRRAFRLFSNSDLAAQGGHGVGNYGTYVSNVGPCDLQFSFGVCQLAFGPPYAPSAWTFQFFEVPFIAGVPKSDWDSAVLRVPTLAAAKGGGWSVIQNFALFAGRLEWGPADGTLGNLFSGVTSTEDGGCRDNTSGFNGFVGGGTPLLASSTCPETWASTGFDGRYRIPIESWASLYATQGASFRFDFHRVPEDLQDQSKFLGAFQTYGRTSDHYREILAAYPPVTPSGVGDPNGILGWPLGLDIDWHAYTFTLPTVASVVYMEALVINRSEDIYGVGLDFDSLYFGLMPGTGGSTGGGGQRFSNYYLADRSTALYHQSGVNPANCGNVPAGGLGCAGGTTGAGTNGYENAGNAIIVLKSPYGDLRNKLFTRPGSPFFNPAHPAAGDTITFNHGHMCGFGGCWANTHNVSDKRAFGVLASQEAAELDGRDPATLTTTEAWRTYRNREYPTVRAVFNRWVPGGFDPNLDGVQDTLFYDTCGGNTPAQQALGCVTTDADTMPGGHANAYGNVGGILATGPFPLAAGDTAVFVFAFLADKDSARTFATINAAIDFYLNFSLGPEPPPVVDVVSTQLRAAGVDQSAQVSIYYTDAPERYTDPFLEKFADDLGAAPPGTELYRLAQLNPDFEDSVRARAASNLARLYVFKSCDGGNNFTSDGDCDGDPAVDQFGNPVGVGWRAYATLERSDFAGGDLPNVFTDGSVIGGQSYLYVILGESIGASFLLRDSIDTDGDGAFDDVGGRQFTVADPLTNPLSRSASDPNVLSIYIPASRQAGSVGAAAAIQPDAAGSTAPFSVDATDSARAGSYVAAFGNRLRIVETRDSSAALELESTSVYVERVVFADTGGGFGDTVVFAVDTGFTTNELGVPYAGSPAVTVTATATGTTTEYVFGAIGFSVFRGTEPLFVSTTLTGSAATPAASFARADFPGFVVSANNINATNFADEQTITPAGDTVSQANVNSFSVQWVDGSAVRAAGFVGSQYELSWLSDPFGLTRGLTLNLSNPSATEAELAAALSARPTGTIALTDAATATLTGVAATDLVAARMPFTIRNITTGKPVSLAMRARSSNTILLGSGLDTIRVALAATEWAPGDALILIDSVVTDSVVGGLVQLGAGGQPIPAPGRRVSFSTAILGCNTPRASCNPVAALTTGQTGYVPLEAGTRTRWHYTVGFRRDSRFSFDVTAPVTGTSIAQVTAAQLDSIRVVPNPFVIFSRYQNSQTGGISESRVLFTHVPPSGTLRVYTISGQFAQQVTWTAADLNGNGDLFYNLRTREGTDLASGLYIWVITTNVGGRTLTKRGKFVVIRGQNN